MAAYDWAAVVLVLLRRLRASVPLFGLPQMKRQAPRLEMPHRLTVRVYYEDTDFSGLVYHASYLRFLERGRTEFLRTLGIEHRSFANGDAAGFHFVVRAMGIEFLRPALMDDLLSVGTRLAAVGGASIEMEQEIQRGDEVLLTADVRIAVVSAGKPRRIPPEVLAKLKALQGEGLNLQEAVRVT